MSAEHSRESTNATQFTAFDMRARLSIPSTMDAGQARRAMERAASQCLISNSLKATVHLTIDIDIDLVVIPYEPVASAHS